MCVLSIREAEPRDHDAVWQIFHEIVSRGTTYAYAPDTGKEEALRLWIKKPRACYVAEREGQIVGTYYLKTNQPGRGSRRKRP